MTKKDRNFPRLEEIEHTWEVDAMWDSGLDPGPKKRALVDIGEILLWSVYQF